MKHDHKQPHIPIAKQPNNAQNQQDMPFPILSQEFMDNMLNMAANMDPHKIVNANNNPNANQQHNQKKKNQLGMQRHSKPHNLSPFNNANNANPARNHMHNQQHNKNAQSFNIPPPQPNHVKMKSLPNQFARNHEPPNMYNMHNNHHNNNNQMKHAQPAPAGPYPLDHALSNPIVPHNNVNVMAAAAGYGHNEEEEVVDRDVDVDHDYEHKSGASVSHHVDPRDDPSVHGASEIDPDEFDSPIQAELVSMGFERQYVTRACNLYKKKFKNKPLRLEVLTEIIIRLQQRDRDKYRHRAKSIESVDSEHKRRNKAMQSVNQSIAPDVKRRSSFQAGVINDNNGNLGAVNVNVESNLHVISDQHQYAYHSHDDHSNNNKYGYAQAPNGGPALQQSISHQNYMYNDFQPQQAQQAQQPAERAVVVSFNRDANQNEMESVTVQIVMSRSSVGKQECDIVIGKDQTFGELKQLVSTCLTDFDAKDECYVFFHDATGFVFDDCDMMIFQALQLMDFDVDAKNLHVTLKIARSVTQYMKK